MRPLDNPSGCTKRHGASLTPAASTPAGSAAPSIWALAQGIGVSTSRHGGRHVEMPAGRPASSVWALAQGSAADGGVA